MNWYSIPQSIVIGFQGTEHEKFLQGFVTQDVRGIKDGESRESIVTDVKGRVLAHGFVFRAGASLYFWTIGNDYERLFAHFDRYIIREDVTLSDHSTQWDWYAMSDLLASDSDALIESFDSFALNLFRQETEVLSDQKSGGIHWTIREKRMVLVGAPSDQSKPECITDVKQIGFEDARIAIGWPLLDTDYDAKTLPQELNRTEAAICFTKGCYLGQETVARLDALGQIQKQVVGLELVRANENAEDAGGLSSNLPLELVNAAEQVVGKITSVSTTENRDGNYFAIGTAKRGAFGIGTELRLSQIPWRAKVIS